MQGGRLLWTFILAAIVVVPLAPAGIERAEISQKWGDDDPLPLHNDTGRRWDIDGLTILYLNGTFYEMGYQQGTLLKAEITRNLRAFHAFYEDEQDIHHGDLVDTWEKQEPYVCQEVIDYIQGTADALGVPFTDIACIWVAEGTAYSIHCCSMAAWGSATATGDLLQLRSMEFPLDIIDPQTGAYIQDTPVLVVGDPVDGCGFIYPTFAGYVVEDGMNENGVVVANMWSPNHDHRSQGAPMGTRLFETLFTAHTAQDAIDIITSDRTFGYNFVVSDGKTPPAGYAVETTANHTYVGSWDGPAEALPPFWSIKDVVRRSNMFLDPATAALQRDPYNPRHPRHILGMLQGEPWYYVWHHYKALSNGVDRLRGTLTLNTTFDMLRDVYTGRYDPVWRLLVSGYPKETWWQWVVRPATGEIRISFAERERSAYHNDIHGLNLLETLENKYPS